MKSFLTGSRAYGIPHADSDIDLVILVESSDLWHLIEQADNREGTLNGSGGPDDVSLRFGKLNLICLPDPEKFELWRKATADLVARAPLSRQEAVDYHRLHVDVEICMRRLTPTTLP